MGTGAPGILWLHKGPGCPSAYQKQPAACSVGEVWGPGGLASWGEPGQDGGDWRRALHLGRGWGFEAWLRQLL